MAEIFRCRFLTKQPFRRMAADYEVSKLERGKRIMTEDKTGDNLTVTERNVSELIARVTVLESQVVTLTAERDAALSQLKQANDLIEADTKARLVEQAVGLSEMTLAELAGKDIAELETIITVSKLVKKSRFESGADIAPKGGKDKFDARTHLHNLYVGNQK